MPLFGVGIKSKTNGKSDELGSKTRETDLKK